MKLNQAMWLCSDCLCGKLDGDGFCLFQWNFFLDGLLMSYLSLLMLYTLSIKDFAEKTRLSKLNKNFKNLKVAFSKRTMTYGQKWGGKLETPTKRLQGFNDNIKSSIVDQVNESVMNIKDPILDA